MNADDFFVPYRSSDSESTPKSHKETFSPGLVSFSRPTLKLEQQSYNSKLRILKKVISSINKDGPSSAKKPTKILTRPNSVTNL